MKPFISRGTIRAIIRIGILASAALIAMGVPALTQATGSLGPARPALRHHVTVRGDLVRIGDLIENAGAAASVPVFRAPDLGHTGSVPVDRVIAAVRPHALLPIDPGDLSEVVVTRASRAFAPEDIESHIARMLSADHGLGETEHIDIRFDRELHTIHVDPDAGGALRLDRLYFNRGNARFDAYFALPGNGTRKPLRVTGRAVATVPVVTLARPVARGEVIKINDLVADKRPRTETPSNAVASLEHAIGLAARRALGPNRPLLGTDLMKPELVQRDQAVTLIFQVPGVMLTMRGKALESGAEGDAVSVLNVQSKRTIQGTVVGPGRIVVAATNVRTADANTATSSVSNRAR